LRVDEHGEEVEVDWSRGADGEGEEDEEGEDLGPKQIDHDLESEPKRTKISAHSEKVNDKNDSSHKKPPIDASALNQSAFKDLVQGMTEEEFMAFLRKKAEEILDVSVNTVLDGQ
jgi:hypothetical protein